MASSKMEAILLKVIVNPKSLTIRCTIPNRKQNGIVFSFHAGYLCKK